MITADFKELWIALANPYQGTDGVLKLEVTMTPLQIDKDRGAKIVRSKLEDDEVRG